MSRLPRAQASRGQRGRKTGAPLRLAICLLAAAIVLPGTARAARADEAEDLRNQILSGGAGKWPVVMKSLDHSPSMAGAVLGPLFRDRSVKSPSAFAAAWLCDHAPKDTPPLLADDVMRRAQDDTPYVEELRGYLVRDGGGWAALVAAARRRLRDGAGDPALVSAAAWLLRHDLSKGAALDLLDAWESGPEQARKVAGESLEALLAFRFAKGPAAARAWMAAHERQSLAEWLRELSREKDRPSAPLYERMLQEAKANVDRAATPADLERYLLPSETPWVEVRQMAARRAARLEAPGEAWLPVLLPVLREEQDQDALLALLDVGRQMRTLSGGTASELAHEVVRRLSECCHHEGLTRGLLRLLSSVGDRDTVAKAYESVEAAADPETLETWVAVAGDVGGSEVPLVRLYQERISKEDEANVRLRTRALEALAHGAPKTREGEGVVGPFLRAVLRRGDGVPGEESSPREAAPAARLAAVRGLEGFPAPATALRLAEVVRDPAEDPAVPALAAAVLGRLASRSPEAASALIDLAKSEGPASVRAEAVRDLAKAAADAPEETRARAAEAVRAALARATGSLDVRIAALGAAAALGDPLALGLACDLASDLAKQSLGAIAPEVENGIERLALAVAKAGDGHDAEILECLESLSRAGALDAAVAVADAAADAGAGRLALQVGRARLLYRRSGVAGRPAVMRRDDLCDADRILRTVERGTASKDAAGEAWKEGLSLHDSVLSDLLADPAIEVELRRSALLETLEVAVLRGDEPAARRALSVVATIQAMGPTPAEQSALYEAVLALERLVHPPPPK